MPYKITYVYGPGSVGINKVNGPKSVMERLTEILPTFNNYRDFLNAVRSMGRSIHPKSASQIEAMTAGLYFDELRGRSADSIEQFMEDLNASAQEFAQALYGSLFGLHQPERFIPKVKRDVFVKAMQDHFETLAESRRSLYQEAAAGEIDLSADDNLAILPQTRDLEILAIKAGLTIDLQSQYAEIARYGLLRALTALDNQGIATNSTFQHYAYTSLTFAGDALHCMREDQLHDELSANFDSVGKNLEQLLTIDGEKVKGLLVEKPKEEHPFVARYQDEIQTIEKRAHELSDTIYGREKQAMLPERYRLIADYFRAGLFYETLGDIENAALRFDDTNHEFDDFAGLAEGETLELLLEHYMAFRRIAEELNIVLKDDFTTMMQQKLYPYREAQRTAQPKGLFRRIVGGLYLGVHERPQFAGDGSLDDVMVACQDRFAEDRAKMQIIRSERTISDREKAELIVRTFINGLVFAYGDEEMLRRFGLQPGERYDSEARFTDINYLDRVSALEQRINELRGDKKTAATQKDQQELLTLRHALHKLRTGVYAIDESEMKTHNQRTDAELVQVRGRVTERDILDPERTLQRDTFIQYMTARLSGRGVIPALDNLRRSQGMGFDVEEAWKNTKAVIPELKVIEEAGIAQLAHHVGTMLADGHDTALVLEAAIEEFFPEHEQRTIQQRVGDALTQGLNALQRVKLLAGKR